VDRVSRRGLELTRVRGIFLLLTILVNHCVFW
jgi:hypothetical protein